MRGAATQAMRCHRRGGGNTADARPPPRREGWLILSTGMRQRQAAAGFRDMRRSAIAMTLLRSGVIANQISVGPS